jgi:hypothetical protein
MLTIDDCIALSELTEDEIDALAMHEDLTEMAALELGNYLLHLPNGERAIRQILLDDIERAYDQRHYAHSAKLKLVLKTFIQTHPKASVRAVER